MFFGHKTENSTLVKKFYENTIAFLLSKIIIYEKVMIYNYNFVISEALLLELGRNEERDIVCKLLEINAC